MLEEFNQYIKDYKRFPNIDLIQNELMSNIMKKCIEIKQLNETTKLVNIILNNKFQLSLKLQKVHEIYESNIFIQRIKEHDNQANSMKTRFNKISNYLQKCEEDNKNNEIQLKALKNQAAKIYDVFYKIKHAPKPQPPPMTNQGPSEEVMLTLTKEERYRILGIKSDIVHTLSELLCLSRWLSVEKATKLDLLLKALTKISVHYHFIHCMIILYLA